ncbi:sensor histidine kinase [Paenibacillus radicis (ex Gao et al. 2016)]|uniref:histidine kinase n=1 Tax=Paenibacillus radicis (ex Gao et al. 2016) TaxID=1737354 RepID=A0A917HA18_9BACL|nr:ATP-binding protein [Paenibacillus radicis (ex Gao et al. 2016)]GGG72144.1 two-component sensor histidine kinase [Paenibacillus radicis (ex Gao et al. 2016)]
MKIKPLLVLTLALLIVGALFPVYLFRTAPSEQLDPVQVNDIVKTVSDNWLQVQDTASLPKLPYELDYAVVDSKGQLIAATRNGQYESISHAIRNRDTLVDIEKDGQIVGKAVFYNDTAATWKSYRTTLIIAYMSFLTLLLAVYLVYTAYLNHTIIRPFHKMKKFAGNIAAGNFDVPLDIDRSNIFGVFTESFDMMREQLHLARESERKANQSKKELVASLSHDIKTPLASIKAVSELMLVTAGSERTAEQLKAIGMKADQIEALLTNLFHATMKELQELTVTVAEMPSTALPDLIRNADYESQVKPYDIPDCVIVADISRLQQVLDNLISNSYKYAGTPIAINTAFEDGFLVLEIADYGDGVPYEELPLLFNKYYRGKNADGISGYGLGLYISSYLIEKMLGELRVKKQTDGFTVILMLRLAE